jgi:hypothetical protein
MLNDAFDSIFDAALKALVPGQRLAVGEWSTGRRSRVMNHLRKSYPKLFGKQGREVIFIGSIGDINYLMHNKHTILTEMGIQGSRPAGSPTPEWHAQAQQNAEDTTERYDPHANRLPYSQQLEDLSSIITLVVDGGASNACFVAGRGGVGKSHIVEETLHSIGRYDGDGFFKNSGTSSASGLYRLLYMHRKDTLVFDDSDGSLSDQDSRNLFKAATDTKKVRKLAWTKSSKNLVDPQYFEDDMLEDGMLPSWFEFTGKIIFISNLSINKLDPDGALRTRAMMISIDPTDEEVLTMMDTLCLTMPIESGKYLSPEHRLEVVEALRESKNGHSLNLRKLVRGLNLRAADPKGTMWKRMIENYV